MALVAWALLALLLHWHWWFQGCVSHFLLFSTRYSCTASAFQECSQNHSWSCCGSRGVLIRLDSAGLHSQQSSPSLARSCHVNPTDLASVLFHWLFSPFSRSGHFHAWVCYFCYALGLASSCLLIIFVYFFFFTQFFDIFLRGRFFLMFYFQAFWFSDIIFVWWISSHFLVYFAISSLQ